MSYAKLTTTLIACLVGPGLSGTRASSADLRAEAHRAAKRATAFLTDQVSTEGGYLWRYTADLSLREGEGQVDTPTVWVQPPGTPSVGEAFVNLYESTGDVQFLAAAKRAADALRRGQMRSGGWQAMVEFDPQRRTRWDYRVNPPRADAKDQSSLDDDKTQSALRFVMRLDRATGFKDPAVHEMATYGIDRLIDRGQFANGGFPQVWLDEPYAAEAGKRQKANFPTSWPREYPGHNQYWERYTLNDNLAFDVLQTLKLAHQIYAGPGEESPYRDAAIRLADFLLLAQMPKPQPAWAQQYNYQMQPIWARKFEPPAVTGGESQGVIRTLLNAYAWIGDTKYLKPVAEALDYLEDSALPSGKLARFYELETNRPLYFTSTYELTYDADNVPTHYAFEVSNQLDGLRRQYQQLRDATPDRRSAYFEDTYSVNERSIKSILESLDARGAWVSDQAMRYHRHPGPVIDMRETVKNLNLLAEYLGN